MGASCHLDGYRGGESRKTPNGSFTPQAHASCGYATPIDRRRSIGVTRGRDGRFGVVWMNWPSYCDVLHGFNRRSGEKLRNVVLHNLTPAAMLTLWLCWSAMVGRLCAEEQPRVPGLFQSQETQPTEQLTWLEDGPAPLFQSLPHLDESILGEPVLSTASQPDRRLGTDHERRSPLTSRLWWIPNQRVQNQPNSFAMNSEEFEVAFPLHIAPNGIWLGLGSVQRLEISTSAMLPDSGRPVPNELWDIDVGAMHVRTFENDWRSGGMFRVGSPSDRPFADLRDLTVTILGFLSVPSGERDAWNFSLFYSPTGQINFPIPGVAYAWRPTPQFNVNLGIPFSLDYRLTESLTITASYQPLNNMQVLARQSLGETWSIYGAYRTVSETFLLAERLDRSERTYLFDQRLTLGVERQLGRGWSVDLAAAYVFDRQMFQAEKFSGTRRDELAIDPGMAGMLQLVWKR